MKLQAQNVSWSVRGKTIISDISLATSDREVIGLTGPNGSGKSTLLRVLAGLRKPSAGDVRLDGRPVRSLTRRAIAQRVAFVEQQVDTSDVITVRSAVKLGRTPWLSPLSPWSARDDQIVDRALVDVDMSHMADRIWHTLSGGERQRVQIARALAQEPSILLFDEPTNHLDVEHQQSILRLISRLHQTSIIALHDLNHALDCDRLMVMEQGRIRASGIPHEVLTPDLLRETFKVRARYLTDPEDGRQILRFH